MLALLGPKGMERSPPIQAVVGQGEPLLGPQALQSGSYNRPGYLRLDFAWQGALTAQQRSDIEDVANAQITLDGVPVAELSYKQATPYLNVAAGESAASPESPRSPHCGHQPQGRGRLLPSLHRAAHRHRRYPTPRPHPPGTVYSAFAEGLSNDTGVNNIAVAPVADAVYQYMTARVSHASASAPAVDVYLKDDVDMVSTKIVTDISFGQFSRRLGLRL